MTLLCAFATNEKQLLFDSLMIINGMRYVPSLNLTILYRPFFDVKETALRAL